MDGVVLRIEIQDEFCEGRPKSVVVPEFIDAVRKLILQNRHKTYCEIEPTIGISGTSIHIILLVYEHLIVKTKFSRRISHSLSIA